MASCAFLSLARVNAAMKVGLDLVLFQAYTIDDFIEDLLKRSYIQPKGDGGVAKRLLESELYLAVQQICG